MGTGTETTGTAGAEGSTGNAGAGSQTGATGTEESITGGNQGSNAGKEKETGAGGGAGKETTAKTGQEGDSGENKGAGQLQESKTAQSTGVFEAKLPDGVQADAALLKPFAELVQKAGISHEAAQQIVDLYAKRAAELGSESVKAAQEGFSKQQEEWKGAIQKQYGAKYEETVKGVQDVVTKFGGPQADELRKALNVTGLGNFPPLVDLLANVAKANAEDRIGGTARGEPSGQRSQEERLRARFPTMFEQKQT
ncbi:MAG TPA: hypothetical protein VMK12_07040 [Anaeromyxobacteraceae bacterium]|nr:hypothetical protein [Anaeromyxobacteraceae bacterium]